MLALLRTHGLDPAALARRPSARSCGLAMTPRDRADRSACSASTRRPTGRTRCTRRGPRPTSRPTATRTSSSSCCTPAATSRWPRSGSTVRLDFEGDQWTFFKPDPRDLERCSASTSTRCSRTDRCPTRSPSCSAAGRTMTVELDAWFLPDTAATSYRAEHVKTPVIPEAIDPDGERLRYFHNASLYELGGADYRGIFRLDVADAGGPAALHRARALRRRAAARPAPTLRGASLDALRHHLDAGARRATRSRASASGSAPTCPILLDRRRRDLPRVRVRHRPDGRRRVRAAGVARRLAARRRRRAGVTRPWARSSRAPRCWASSSLDSERSIRTRSVAANVAGPGQDAMAASGARSAERMTAIGAPRCMSRRPASICARSRRAGSSHLASVTLDPSAPRLGLDPGAACRAPSPAPTATRGRRSRPIWTSATGGSARRFDAAPAAAGEEMRPPPRRHRDDRRGAARRARAGDERVDVRSA